MRLINLPADTHICCGLLWDGLSGEADGPFHLVIRGGRIHEILPAPTTPVPGSLDFSACTVMPALVDAHVHLAFPESGGTSASKNATAYPAAGVAAVRDAGSASLFGHPPSPPLVVTTGQAISKAGCYGANLGQPVTSLSEAEGMVDYLASLGVGQIKVIASGIFSFTAYGKIGQVPFYAAELAVITARARLYNLPVMAHASGDEAVKRCLRAGVHSIEHGYFLSEESLRAMAASGTFWTPTLAPVAAWLNSPTLFPSLSEHSREVVHRSLERHKEMVALADSLGVRIATGTDAGAPGVPHGSSLKDEIRLLTSCGLSSARALRAATATAAAALGLAGEMGQVLPGFRPYLTVINGNPLADLSSLERVEALLLPS